MIPPSVPLRHIADVRVSNVDKRTIDGERSIRLCNYTDVYYRDAITDELDFMESTATLQQIRSFALRRGDTLITKDSETAGDIAVPAFVPKDLPGVVSGYHLAIVRPDPSRIYPAFLFRILQSDYEREQFTVAASGVTRYGLTYGAIRGVAVPQVIADLDDQRRIANFLDDQTSRIDQLIELRRAQRDQVGDWFRSYLEDMLSRSVEQQRLSSLTDPSRPIQYGIVLPGPNFDGGVPIVKGGDVAAHRMDPSGLNRTDPVIDAAYPRSRLAAGDLLIAIRGSVGELATVPPELAGANITQDAARIAPRGVDADWLRWTLQAPLVQGRIAERVTGATVRGINIGDLRRVLVPWVDRHKQTRLGMLAARTARHVKNLDFELTSSVARLQERKRALITAAVTGEFDVTTASGRGGG